MVDSWLRCAPLVRHRPGSSTLAVCVFALVGATAGATAAVAPATGAAAAGRPGITLEKITSAPDWIGAPVKDAYWSADRRAAYYRVKRGGSPIVDLHRVDLTDGKDQIVEPQAMAGADGPAVLHAAGQ